MVAERPKKVYGVVIRTGLVAESMVRTHVTRPAEFDWKSFDMMLNVNVLANCHRPQRFPNLICRIK